jgi:hypothetical protein
MQKHKFGITCLDALFSGIHTGPTQARKIVHRQFTAQTHRNALRDPQIIPDAKHKFGPLCPGALFAESIPVPPELEK